MHARLTLALVFTIGLLLRAYFAATPYIVDVQNFERSAAIFAQGGNIYTEQYFFNYSPVLALPLVIARAAPLPFFLSWRLLISLISAVNGILIARLSRSPARVFMLWWLNPAVIILDGYYGQTEAFAMLPLLAAVCWSNYRTFIGGTLALLVKHLTLPLVWCLFIYRTNVKRAAWWMVAALAIFMATFIPYLPDGAVRIVTRVFLYNSWGGYGFGSTPLFIAAIVSLPFIARWLRMDVIDALLLTALGQLTFAYGASLSHLYLVLALGAVRPSRWLILPSLVVCIMPGGLDAMMGSHNLVWAAVLPWFVYLVVKRRAMEAKQQ